MLVTVTYAGRTTTAEARAAYGKDHYVGVGRAVCAEEDHYVRAVGEHVAVARAIRDLGRQIEESWGSRVITKEQLRERREQKALKRSVAQGVIAPPRARNVEIEV